MDKLPESTNSPASLTSEPEKLLSETQLGHVIGACSEDDGVPDIGVSIGLGEGSMLWLGELLKRDGGDIGFVFHGPDGQRHVAPIWPACEWQDVADLLRHHVAPILARLSSPVSVTDQYREADLREAIRAAKVAADKTYGLAWSHLEEISRVELILAALSASPTPPIPVIAEAGERDLPALFEAWWRGYEHGGQEPAKYSRKKHIAFDAFCAALSTPATLDNTAVRVAREALGTAQEWIDKRDQLYDWTSSAWLAGEEQQKPPEGIGTFLSSLIGWLMAGEEAAAALATLTAKTEKAE